MNLRKDLFPIFKKHRITFDSKTHDSEDIYTFNFIPKKPIHWMAGQHGIFIITHKKIKRSIRPFSVSSSPTEGIIKISVKIGHQPSEFKQALLDLKLGQELIMRGPVGGFYLKDEKPLIFITGGIGITPYRSIIKNLIDSNDKTSRNIDMIYIDRSKVFLYKEFFDDAKNFLNLNMEYLLERKALHNKLIDYIQMNQNNSNYFVAGPKSLVDDVVKTLKTHGIKRKNIVKDTFIGY